jgi:tRNA G18 (ribose-2'-O)-methylase SpoU
MIDAPLAIVLPDIRSAQNVGSVLRTADAAGVSLVITCGYTPHLPAPGDNRPPHVARANAAAIAKTAFGAELTVPQRHFESLAEAFSYLHHNHYTIAALEQAENSENIYDFVPTSPLALVVGNEVDGVSPATLASCDLVLELPMRGQKESLNVAVAAGIAMYQLRFGPDR